MQVHLEPPPSLPLAAQPSGAIMITGTRVPLEAIVYAYRDGSCVEQIADDFPSVGVSAAYWVVAFYISRRAEIDAYVTAREQSANAVRQQNEAKFPRAGIRERLLARRNGKNA